MDFCPRNYQDISSICVCITLVIGLGTYLRSVKMNRMDFYFKIKNDFYSDESKLLSKCIREGTVKSKTENEIPYLTYDKINEKDNNKEEVELKLDLLDSIEDLYLFYGDGLISKRHLIEGFGETITQTYKNDDIQNFIFVKNKNKVDGDIYVGLKKLNDVVLKKPSLMCGFFTYLDEKYRKFRYFS
jgi:hypothetical protein